MLFLLQLLDWWFNYFCFQAYVFWSKWLRNLWLKKKLRMGPCMEDNGFCTVIIISKTVFQRLRHQPSKTHFYENHFAYLDKSHNPLHLITFFKFFFAASSLFTVYLNFFLLNLNWIGYYTNFMNVMM